VQNEFFNRLRCHRGVSIAVFCAASLTMGPMAVSQPPDHPASSQDASGHPDFSGYWELRHDSRSIPPAVLTDEAKGKLGQQKEHDVLAVRWCANVGMPFLMDDNATLDVRQSSKVIGLMAKTVSSMRYIYIDGRKHPSPDELDPTTNGHSIAHWEGDQLVVDTVGFSDRGITAIPGGGYRTPTSHLTERFRLMNKGEMLSVKATWEDPHVFAQPHSYEYRYYRVAKNEYPLQYPCDARNAERASFLIPK